jgi:Sec-independent protein translocase protein TatA
VEYDSRNREPGTEIPSLGKAQFEIIAEASLEFDKYLNVTLRGTDADLAEREETRADKFSAQSLGKTAKNVRVAVRSVKRGAREPESELEISSDDSESESESEDDDEDEDEEEDEDEDKNEEEFVPKSNGNGKLGFTKGSKSMKKRKG